MRAIQFAHYGQPTVLETVELPRPEAGPGEALVRVAGTTFNQVDATIRAGYLAEVFPVDLPHVPGIDVSGTVVAVGAGVPGDLVGRDIVAFLPMTGPGASAEYAIVPAELIAPAPTSIPLDGCRGAGLERPHRLAGDRRAGRRPRRAARARERRGRRSRRLRRAARRRGRRDGDRHGQRQKP